MFISQFGRKKNYDPMRYTSRDFDKVTKCGCCHHSNWRKLVTVIPELDIDYVECINCGAITYNRVLTDDNIRKLYDENYGFFGNNDEKVTFSGSDRFGIHLYNIIHTIANSSARILDFGGGDGTLACSLANLMTEINRIEITVVDYCEELCEVDKNRITIKHVDPPISKYITNDRYDVVIASGIIEHLKDPYDDIRSLIHLLDTGGIIYFRTPFVYSLYRLLSRFGIEFETAWPDHIWDLGRKYYSLLPRSIGMENELLPLISRPSIVERSLKNDFWVALASHIMKAPYYIFHAWPYVGGWEAVFQKK